MTESLPAATPSQPPPRYNAILLSDLGPGDAEALRQALIEAISSPPAAAGDGAIRLEAGAVDRLSTGSLQVLLAAASRMHGQGRRLVLAEPSPRLREWLRLAGAARLMDGAENGGEL